MRLAACACVLAIFAIPVAEAHAVTLKHTYHFDRSRLELACKAFRAPGLQVTWERDRPQVPYETVTFLVPQGSRLVALRARTDAEVDFAPSAALELAAPIQDEDGRAAEPPPMSSIAPVVGAPMPGPGYPVRRAEAVGAGFLHGYQLLSVRVFPVREDPTGRILVTRRIDLELDLTAGGVRPLERGRWSPAIETTARHMLQGFVANPEAIDSYSRRLGLRVETGHGGFHPTAAPSLEGSDVDDVIITTAALASSWQVLADWKTRRGVPTVVRTVEWIQANYKHGSDLQETIRTFIKDAYADWAVQYVLLGGDTALLPVRYGFSAIGEGADRSIPSDLYFGCLDGNWNQDGDDLWGEAATTTSPVDSTDLYPEVLVGRVAAGTSAKVDVVVSKLMSYENPVQTSYQNKLLLLGEVLFPVGWTTGQPVYTDGGDFSDDVAAFAPACVVTKKLYDNTAEHPGALPLSRQATLDEMNSGYGIVNHIGHGYRYSMSCGDKSLVNADAVQLVNGSQRFILFMLNCTATAFDFPCLAEAFLEAAGGGVAVLGSSRSTFVQPAHFYNNGFFQALYQQGWMHLGQCFAQSRLSSTPNAWYDTADHYSHLIYNLLGDPAMVVHTCTLGVTAVTYPASLGLGLTSVTVNVEVDGVARQGALVCLQKDTEEYQHGTTDAGGNVTLPFRVETGGSVQVCVSGQNLRTHLGTITVNTGSVAYVRNQSVMIDDDAMGASNGNSDGVLDAGETIELNLGFANGGTASSGSVTGILRIPGPGITVQDSTYSFGGVAAGGGVTVNGQVRFLVPSGTADGTVLPLTFVTTSGSATWTDVAQKVVHAPRMSSTWLDVLDPAPGGNGDGLIQAGETFDLLAYFKNYGTGAADGLVATLTTSDADVQITTGSTSLGRAIALQELTSPTHFRVRETVLAENSMTLQLTDNRGRSKSWPITLRGPAKPAPPALDTSTGSSIVIARWAPSADTDLAGYDLYRATNILGPWTRVSLDRTERVAYFRDAGLQPSTRYWYYVTALDTSGNESLPSDVTSISTNPAQLAGWPINMGASSSCPVAVGDITGDGPKEIVAGDDHLYAWHWNGIELRDDDGDPQTWGNFVNEVTTVTGAVALAQCDGLAGYEVFATTWDDSNRAWLVRGDGSVMPGWPRMPDRTSAQRGYWAASAAMDVDGDGRAELFAAAKNGNLYAWHPNGTPLGAAEAFKSGLGTFSRSSPTFANLDTDPQAEIVYAATNGTLYVWNADGSNLPHFPKNLGTACYANTAIGDVNKDGVLDIVMITEGGAVNVLDSKTGNQILGFPQNLPVYASPISPSPALADFDADGKLEIVVANNDLNPSLSAVRVYNWQGNLLPGWPKTAGGSTGESSPIVADVSGDGVPDILFGNEGGLLYGWDKNGNDIAGFPLSIGDFIRSTPFADDVDGDGNIDLVLAGWNKNVYIWDLPVPYNKAAAQWPTLKHDAQRSGYYKFRPTSTTEVDPVPPPAAPPRACVAQNEPNPFNPVTTIGYGVPALRGAAPVEVHLDIFAADGRFVRRLLRGSRHPGTYKALWDGRDERGARARSGIYFYRLQVEGEAVSRKMLLLQ